MAERREKRGQRNKIKQKHQKGGPTTQKLGKTLIGQGKAKHPKHSIKNQQIEHQRIKQSFFFGSFL